MSILCATRSEKVCVLLFVTFRGSRFYESLLCFFCLPVSYVYDFSIVNIFSMCGWNRKYDLQKCEVISLTSTLYIYNYNLITVIQCDLVVQFGFSIDLQVLLNR